MNCRRWMKRPTRSQPTTPTKAPITPGRTRSRSIREASLTTHHRPSKQPGMGSGGAVECAGTVTRDDQLDAVAALGRDGNHEHVLEVTDHAMDDHRARTVGDDVRGDRAERGS